MPASLEFATNEELALYEDLQSRLLALQSPLDYAEYISPGTKRYKHIELINREIVALCEYRLYAHGEGPPARWFYKTYVEGVLTTTEVDSIFDIPLDNLEEANKIVDYWGEHPETGEHVVFMLAIKMAPRHGKSYLITEHTAPWYISRWPDRRAAVTTYSDDFAYEWGQKVKDQLEGPKSLLQMNGNREHLTVQGRDGSIRFAGVGGRLTGSGFDFGLIDDPFKNAEEALSKAERDRKDNWYGSTFLTRREPRAIHVMMFTPWHEDDLSGRRLYDEEDNPRDDWRILHLKAICDSDDDPLGRAEGEALCPPRFPISALLKIQRDDPEWFDAMYQGEPGISTAKKYGVHRHYKFVGDSYGLVPLDDEELEEGQEFVREYRITDGIRFATVDLAASLKSWADWSVFAVWDYHPVHNMLFLADLARSRVETTDHISWITEHADAHRIKYIGLEPKTYGLNALNELKRDTSYFITALDADTDKVSRSLPFYRRIKLGLVAFPAEATWRHTYEKEVKAFRSPKGTRHDDQVDVSSYACIMIDTLPGAALGGVIEHKTETFEERLWRHVLQKNKARTQGELQSMM